MYGIIFQTLISSNFVMDMDSRIELCNSGHMFTRCHVDGDSAFTSFICEMVS